jgi:hypothetical protein
MLLAIHLHVVADLKARHWFVQFDFFTPFRLEKGLWLLFSAASCVGGPRSVATTLIHMADLDMPVESRCSI